MENSEEMKERQFKQSNCWSYGNLAAAALKHRDGSCVAEVHLLWEPRPACKSISNLHPEVWESPEWEQKVKMGCKMAAIQLPLVQIEKQCSFQGDSNHPYQTGEVFFCNFY